MTHHHRPSYFSEFGQVGDASMQYAVALLGLSVAPAIINALIIIIGELSPVYDSIRHAWVSASLSR